MISKNLLFHKTNTSVELKAGLQITNGACAGYIVWSNMFLPGHDPFLAGQTLTVVTLTIANPDCTVILLQLKHN